MSSLKVIYTPKGNHFRKYDSKEKLDEKITIRINSELLEKFRKKVDNPQEWIRNQIRKLLSSKNTNPKANLDNFL